MRQVFVLLGPPGAGKGTVANGLVADFGLQTLSSGKLLRDIKATATDLGRQIAELIDEGKFAPDELIIRLVGEKLETYPTDCLLMLDGFPRTLPQAVALDRIIRQNNDNLSMVLEIQADDAELERRVLKRAQEEGRVDDTLETFRHRLSVFRDQTVPLIDYYRKQNKIVVVDGMGTPEEVMERTRLLIQQIWPNGAFIGRKEAG